MTTTTTLKEMEMEMDYYPLYIRIGHQRPQHSKMFIHQPSTVPLHSNMCHPLGLCFLLVLADPRLSPAFFPTLRRWIQPHLLGFRCLEPAQHWQRRTLRLSSDFEQVGPIEMGIVRHEMGHFALEQEACGEGLGSIVVVFSSRDSFMDDEVGEVVAGSKCLHCHVANFFLCYWDS